MRTFFSSRGGERVDTLASKTVVFIKTRGHTRVQGETGDNLPRENILIYLPFGHVSRSATHLERFHDWSAVFGALFARLQYL